MVMGTDDTGGLAVGTAERHPEQVALELEFLEPADAGGRNDEPPAPRRGSGRPVLRAGAIVALVGLGLLVGITRSRSNEAPHGGLAGPTAPPKIVASPSPAARQVDFVGLQLLDMLRSPLAYDAPAMVPERGTCPAVRSATVELRHVVSALRRTLPSYRVTDQIPTIDQFGELCSVVVRAHYLGDRVAVVLVVRAPTPGHATATRDEVGTPLQEFYGRQLLKYVYARSGAGWSVIAASLAPWPGWQPSVTDLLALSTARTLSW
jgi:hypothetical protein